MSFVFPSWETAFSPSFYSDAKAMLETALNKGNKPPVIQGHIEVVDLNMGSQPPTLTLLEIGDLSLDRFRGILRLGYQGDAWITVRCLVQANPLSHNQNLIPSSTLPISAPLLASQPLLVPMTLRLSKLHLRAILILVVSASKGITLVFKNDPLQNVDVSSTFDSVEVIRGYLQQEIEGQLREMFREDLPGIIHRLSQRWFTGSGGTVETPYRDEPATPANTPQNYDEDEYDLSTPLEGRDSLTPHPPPTTNSTPRRRALHRPISGSFKPAQSSNLAESPTSYTVFPDIENYDPTYGLRPEGLPTHSGYEALGRVWEQARTRSRGLGSLMDGSFDDMLEEPVMEDDDDDDAAFQLELDQVDEEVRSPRPGMSRQPSRPGFSRQSSLTPSASASNISAWEVFPAVGGGMITRPRVFHAQSQIRAPSESGFGGTMPSPAAGTAATGSVTARASSIGGTSTVGSLRSFVPQSAYGVRPTSRLQRTWTAASGESRSRPLSGYNETRSRPHSGHTTFGPRAASPTPLHRPGSPLQATATRHMRGSSLSQSVVSFPARGAQELGKRSVSHEPRPRAATTDRKPSVGTVGMARERAPSFGSTLKPGFTLPLNNSVSQLATLTLSANTLSPYARGHEHIAVRSFPHLGQLGRAPTPLPVEDDGSVKARRKRIFRIGGKGGNGKGNESRRASNGSTASAGSATASAPLSPDLDASPPSLEYDDVLASSSSESASRWRVPPTLSARSASLRAVPMLPSYPFTKIPE